MTLSPTSSRSSSTSSTSSGPNPGQVSFPARVPVAVMPDQIASGTLWQRCRADDLALADGTAVASWTDLSGNSRALVQATGANQPTYKVNQVSGSACVRFAANKYMVYSEALAAPYTVFVVGSMPRSSAGTFRYMWVNGSGGRGIGSYSNNAMVFIGGGANNYAPYGCGTLGVYSFRATSAIGQLWRNGIPIMQQSASQGNLSASVVGANSASSPVFVNYDGDIYEVIVFAGDLTAADRVSVEQALCAYYGLPWGQGRGFPALTTTTLSGQTASIWTPGGLSTAAANPLLIVDRGGNSANGDQVITINDFTMLVDVAVQLGFVVAASNDYGTDSVPYGTAKSLSAQLDLYNYVVANVSPTIGTVVTAGVSYGGINSLLNLLGYAGTSGGFTYGLPKAVSAWFGISPVCDPTTMPLSANAIANPVTVPASGFAGKRMYVFSSVSDPIVSTTTNSAALVTHVSTQPREISWQNIVSSVHTDPKVFMQTEVAEFLIRVLQDG